MTVAQEVYDVTIIGGGPAGMYAAFYAGLREMKTKLIEAQPVLGGRMLIYPEKVIWDVGGVPPIVCQKLIDDLAQQARIFDPTICLEQMVTNYERLVDGTLRLTTACGKEHYTRTLILAIGYGIRNLVKLDLEGADRFEVGNLHYTVQELEPFRHKHVLISGGGDSAVEWAVQLEPLAASVTIVHRRDQFGGHERNVTQLRNSTVNIRTPYALHKLHSSDGAFIDQVTLTHIESGQAEVVAVDAVIVNHGMKSDFGPLRQWGLDIGERELNGGPKMESNLPGIFAAGDFIRFDSKVRLIAGAFTDAVLAVNSAKTFIDPNALEVGYVSSHSSRFKEKNRQLGYFYEDYRERKA